jgi:hypothetical protein
VSLEDKPNFAALSYVWGDSNTTEDIILDANQVYVTATLAAALRRVQMHWETEHPERDPTTFRLWADGVCINQLDVEERDGQVRLMGRVFGDAELVFGWLGDLNESSHASQAAANYNGFRPSIAFDVFRTLAKEFERFNQRIEDLLELEWLKSHPDLCIDDDAGEGTEAKNTRWDAVATILAMSYWRRAWIFQEAVLAQRLLLITHDSSCEFEDIQMATQVFHHLQGAITKGALQRPEFISNSVWAFLATAQNWSVAVERISFQRVSRSSGNSPTLSTSRAQLATALFGANLQATDPKDHIYALLGLTGIATVPRYSSNVPVARVYRDFVAAWLAKAYSDHSEPGRLSELQFLTSAGIGAYENSFGLPTWAPNFPEASQSGMQVPPKLSTEIDTLFPRPEAPAAVLGSQLRCEGLQFDTITHLSDPCELPLSVEVVPHFLKHHLTQHPQDVLEMHPLQAVLRALTMNVESDELHELFLNQTLSILFYIVQAVDASTQMSRADLGLRSDGNLGSSIGVIDQVFPGYGLISAVNLVAEIEHLLKLGSNNQLLSTVTDVLAGIKDFRLFETRRGYIGLTGNHTRPGDSIYILKSLNRATVLRTEGDNLFSFVNVCFVVGLETNEARQYLEERKQTIRALYLK